MKKIFVGNCSFSLDEGALQSFAEAQGVQVSSVQIIRDRHTERSRGFGFIELKDSEDLQNAIEALNGKELEGRALTVNEAKEQKPRFGGGGGGGGFGGPSSRPQGGFRRNNRRQPRA